MRLLNYTSQNAKSFYSLKYNLSITISTVYPILKVIHVHHEQKLMFITLPSPFSYNHPSGLFLCMSNCKHFFIIELSINLMSLCYYGVLPTLVGTGRE